MKVTNSSNKVVARAAMQSRPAARISASTPLSAKQSAFCSTFPQSSVQSSAIRVVSTRALQQRVLASGQPMNLVFVSAEVSPWSKTGGLGDVVGGLPIELAKRGHKVMTISPRYDQYKDAWDTSIVIHIDGQPIRFFHTVEKGVDRVWVDHPWFLAKVWGMTGSMLYGRVSGADYADNQRRFALFCKAAIEAVRALPFGPGEKCTFIANDWHSALVPVMLKDIYQKRGEFRDAKSVLCMHNLAFQGRFWPESFKELGLPESSLERFKFEDGYPVVFDERLPADEATIKKLKEKPTGKKYEKINWLRAGITAADKLLTVAPTYAAEVSSNPALGVELDSVIRAHGTLEGIVNGMDTTEWNPATDKFLAAKYDSRTVSQGKALAKAALQAELGFAVDPTIPLFGFIGRLESQKGVDILLAAAERVVRQTKAQVVILGTGNKELEVAAKKLETLAPKMAKGVVKFSAPLAHTITAGADYMVIPSRFEPCGLIQLHAMQYGTVPLVSSVGGLVDTVREGVTGLQMGVMNPDALIESDVDAVAATMVRAAQLYSTPKYTEMSNKAISQNLSWSEPAKKWEGVLEELSFGMNKTAKKASVVVPAATVAA